MATMMMREFKIFQIIYGSLPFFLQRSHTPHNGANDAWRAAERDAAVEAIVNYSLTRTISPVPPVRPDSQPAALYQNSCSYNFNFFSILALLLFLLVHSIALANTLKASILQACVMDERRRNAVAM
jgi:hypothetical protein